MREQVARAIKADVWLPNGVNKAADAAIAAVLEYLIAEAEKDSLDQGPEYYIDFVDWLRAHREETT